MVGVLIELGVRFAVFTAVFWLAAVKWDRVRIERWWARPLVALVFAVLNTALYWAVAPILGIATLGVAGFALPLVVNYGLLLGTAKVLENKPWWLQLDGFFTTLSLAIVLAVVHAGLELAFDQIF